MSPPLRTVKLCHYCSNHGPRCVRHTLRVKQEIEREEILPLLLTQKVQRPSWFTPTLNSSVHQGHTRESLQPTSTVVASGLRPVYPPTVPLPYDTGRLQVRLRLRQQFIYRLVETRYRRVFLTRSLLYDRSVLLVICYRSVRRWKLLPSTPRYSRRKSQVDSNLIIIGVMDRISPGI